MAAVQSADVPDAYNSPTRQRKTAEVVARRLVAEIFEQRVQPGAMLPNEAEMQERLGVGRSTLREALRLLETQGVLSLRAGRGPIVRVPSPEYLLNSLTLLLQFQGATFGSLLEARLLFEPPVARAAAAVVTPDEIAELRRNVDDVRDGDDLPFSQLVKKELDFHRMIARASKNAFAETMVVALAAALSNEAVESVHRHDAGSDLHFHESIVEAMARRDGQAAADAMRTHIADVIDKMTITYPNLSTRVVNWM